MGRLWYHSQPTIDVMQLEYLYFDQICLTSKIQLVIPLLSPLHFLVNLVLYQDKPSNWWVCLFS